MAPYWLFLLVPLLIGIVVQRVLRSVFTRYRNVRNHSGASGAEVARALLDAHDLQRVRLAVAPGTLTDNYDSSTETLSLSEPVARERSVASLGIAAHEVSHAYQDAEGNRAFRWRQAVGEPIAKLAPWSGFILIGGFWLGIPVLVVLSLVYAGGLVLFALATLPVELGASHRALGVLHDTGLANARELGGVRRVLRAAALTYVVGLLDQLGFLLALALVAEAGHAYAT